MARHDNDALYTEKLYSPIFLQIQDAQNDYARDDDTTDSLYPRFQGDVVDFAEDIRDALAKESQYLDKTRGFMGHYHHESAAFRDAVNQKVHSLFVDVEVHDGKLWGVATLTLTEPLTRDELTDLKDFLAEEYSEGFGEGFQQREIKSGDYKLFVRLWRSTDRFFINTAPEFAQRLGIAPETPSQTTTADYRLQVYIENPRDSDLGGFTIPMPTTPEAIKLFAENIEIKNGQGAKIVEVYSYSDDDNNLSFWLNRALKQIPPPHSLEEANYLAVKIQNMSEEQREIFAAALQAKWSCRTIQQMRVLADNLDCFELQPAFSAAHYGEHLLTMEQDNFHSHFDKLLNSKNQDDIAFAMYIGRLEKCLDKDAYGHLFAKEEGGAFTDYGYLTQEKEMKVYRDAWEIPAEHRIPKGKGRTVEMAQEQETASIPEKKPVKVKVRPQATLAETLKIHAQRSREQFGDATQTQNRETGEPSL